MPKVDWLPKAEFTPTQPNVDGVVSSAIRLAMLEDAYERHVSGIPFDTDRRPQMDELGRLWARIAKARRDLREAVGKLRKGKR